MDSVKVLDQKQGEGWAIYNADCVEMMRGLKEGSMDYSIFSPPFASLSSSRLKSLVVLS